MLAVPLLLFAASEPLAGEWRGTSLCQVRPSPCNDEQAVYRIERAGGGYLVHFGKMVGGKPEEFGATPGTFDASRGELVTLSRDRSGRTFTWRLHLSGNRLTGQLTLPDGTIYRTVDLTRMKPG